MPKQLKPKKPGRPALPKGDAKAVMLRVRVTPNERAAIGMAAKDQDQKPFPNGCVASCQP